MSQTRSFTKKSGSPRFLILLAAAVALWVAIPLLTQAGTATVQADGGMMPGLTAQLTGSPIGSATPRGFAYYVVNAAATPNPVRMLVVNVSNINLPNATVLQVSLNAAPIGTITLTNHTPNSPSTIGGSGSLRLSTLNGDTVPIVVAGDALTVGPAAAAGTTTYLSGTFAAPPTPTATATHTPWPTPSHTPWPTPSHTPWPTPSHTASPSPTGTPRVARAFAARLKGSNEVPPVTTEGLGFGFVCLNAAETQIRVNVGTRNLSGPATAITINGPATAAENGPVIFTLTLPTSFSYVSQTFDVTADQVAQLRAGSWYIQVATAANATGEIRGQLMSVFPHGGNHGSGGGFSDEGGSGSGSGDNRSSASPSIFMQTDNDDLSFPGDFNGDGIIDTAVYYSALGRWDITYGTRTTPLIYKYE